MNNNPVSARSKIYRIALDAMLIAIFVILSMVPSEISWASLPVFVCAFLLGPADAVVIAVCGSFIEQLWYGINATTVLWMLPWALFSLFVGLMAFAIRKKTRVWKMIVIIVIAELLLNLANTTVLCFLGYLSLDFSAELGALLLLYLGRMPQAIIRAVLSSVAVPLLIPPLRKALSRIR